MIGIWLAHDEDVGREAGGAHAGRDGALPVSANRVHRDCS